MATSAGNKFQFPKDSQNLRCERNDVFDASLHSLGRNAPKRSLVIDCFNLLPTSEADFIGAEKGVNNEL